MCIRDSFSDNCPYFFADDKGRCDNSKNSQFNSDTDALYDQYFGFGSRCFTGDYVKSSAGAAFKKGEAHNGCHNFKCEEGTGGNNYVVIQVGGSTVVCPPQGGPVSIDGYQGTINCPNGNEFCKGTLANSCAGVLNYCSGVGKCLANKCFCPLGRETLTCTPPSVTF
eukprot:TRINITY_DN4285_c0_g1_i6.p1 TRINITY_DN4285_c0_g1~~TRINITY_DN4285_c0_g1_i6.p1  ORF type:complete len:167 (+),score=40.27 TRINITY_DN4285_c0_g1_i6:64-564(+)